MMYSIRGFYRVLIPQNDGILETPVAFNGLGISTAHLESNQVLSAIKAYALVYEGIVVPSLMELGMVHCA
jgi:hypothetical protein